MAMPFDELPILFLRQAIVKSPSGEQNEKFVGSAKLLIFRSLEGVFVPQHVDAQFRLLQAPKMSAGDVLGVHAALQLVQMALDCEQHKLDMSEFCKVICISRNDIDLLQEC